MGKVKRIERVAALTKELVDHPYELYSFTDFCERFDVAKSTLSEDVQAIKNGLVAYDLQKTECQRTSLKFKFSKFSQKLKFLLLLD